MANKKISQLDALGTAPAGTDILPITDVSDTTGSAQGTTKGVTVANLHSGLQQEPSEGAFVDGDKTKLDGIEALADVTDATNVEAAGALMDNEVTNLAQVKAFNSADYATAAHTHAIDDLSDVDTSTVAPTTNDFLKWGGSNWVPAVPTADVDTPLTTALRGTDNPHIGAYPNQSFKVTDNPSKSVMVIADADGNLEFVTKDGANVYINTPSSRLALAKGFSVQEDGDEPDIEAVTPSGVTYSVISGDSDTKGINGLPTRQGFNYPDIGANPAPILISGGSIA
jgi:hypothetical protein